MSGMRGRRSSSKIRCRRSRCLIQQCIPSGREFFSSIKQLLVMAPLSKGQLKWTPRASSSAREGARCTPAAAAAGAIEGLEGQWVRGAVQGNQGAVEEDAVGQQQRQGHGAPGALTLPQPLQGQLKGGGRTQRAEWNVGRAWQPGSCQPLHT